MIDPPWVNGPPEYPDDDLQTQVLRQVNHIGFLNYERAQDEWNNSVMNRPGDVLATAQAELESLLNALQHEAYADGRKDEREEVIATLKGEAASVRREGEGCRDARYDWMADGIEAAADAFGGIDSATGKPATPELMKALTAPVAEVMWSDPLAMHGRIKWLGEPAPLGSLLYSSPPRPAPVAPNPLTDAAFIELAEVSGWPESMLSPVVAAKLREYGRAVEAEVRRRQAGE